MQASNDLPDYPPGTACTFAPAGGVGRFTPYPEPGGQSRVKVELILKVEPVSKSNRSAKVEWISAPPASPAALFYVLLCFLAASEI